jgi:hypothetical protein
MGTEFITERDAWDHFVELSPHGTLFHRWDFLKTVERHSGFRLLPLALRKGEAILWLVPLFLSRTYGVKVLVSIPPNSAVPYLGPVPSPIFDGLGQHRKESHLSLLSEEIGGLVREHRPDFTHLSTGPGFTDIRPFLWDGYNARVNYTYILDLSRSLDDIWKSFSSKKRGGISHARKMGYEVRRSTDLRPIHDMATRRYDEQGKTIPLFSHEYLADLQRTFPGELEVYHLLLNGTVEGGMVVLRDRLFRAWLGTTKTAGHGNGLLYWSVIEGSKAEGAPRFDMGGANTPHICSFKNKFNPRLEAYYSLTRTNALGRIAEGLFRLVRS